jgi:hypothetical protein
MRILPYGSAAVKVRVEIGMAKLGHFLGNGAGWRGGHEGSGASSGRSRRNAPGRSAVSRRITRG